MYMLLLFKLFYIVLTHNEMHYKRNDHRNNKYTYRIVLYTIQNKKHREIVCVPCHETR